MKRTTFIAICALLFTGCGSNNHSIEPIDMNTSVESTLRELVQSYDATGGTIMIMDVSTEELIADCTIARDSNGNYRKSTPAPIELGCLHYPMLITNLFASGDKLDSSMMLRVGQKTYPCGYRVVDSHRMMADGLVLDSATLGQAFVERSKVAMCELAEMNCAAHAYASDELYMEALGYGGEMSPYDILQHYNMLAKGMGDTLVIRSLLARVISEGVAGRYADNDIAIAGMPATIALPNETERNNAAFAGFYPAENPKYSCIVILYSTTSKGTDAANAIYSLVK